VAKRFSDCRRRNLNPCPCGYFGDPKRECRCSLVQVQRYRDRISGPLLDRIDIHLDVPAIQYSDLTSQIPGESSAVIRSRIEAARALQRERYGKSKAICNARIGAKQLKAHCQLGEDGEGMMRMAMTELNLSARAYDRILKVSRTIADLAGEENIRAEHVSEAIQYRTLDRNLWM
jgi:magnesium chelatase family protein